jgi:hypothetical protein
MAVSRETLYEQLPADTVRTIVLSPGSQTDPLRCHFRRQKIPPSEKMDVRLSYEALSYTWGAPIFSQFIACRSAAWASSSSTTMTLLRTLHSGRKLKSTEVTISITQNLYDALVHLRQRWTSRELWVDAICINQEDNAEKAAQIPLMGRVYFLAKRVIIWLGLIDEHTTQTLALINMIAITAKLETGLRRPTIHDLELEEFDEARHAQRRLPSWVLEIEKWQALGAFLSRPWFSRVWILQEVILAPEALVQVGGNSMDWADLCTAVTFLVQKYFYASIPPGATNLSQCLDRLLLPCSFSRCVRPAIWNDPTARPMDLCGLLVTSHQYQATVPRDKVYAFLGLANEYDVLVDYAVELRHVYVDVARYLLSKNDAGTRSLCLESVHHYPDIDVEFPSWVPKWHVQLRRIGINDGEADTEFKAGGDDDIEIPRHPSNPSVLELTGFVLGRVEISHKIQDSNNGPEVWDLLVFARSLLYDHTIYPTGDPLDKVIVSTITQVDKSHDIRAFHDLFIDAYQHKLEDLASESKKDEAAAMRGEWQAEVSRLVTMSQEPKPERKVHTRYKNTLIERSLFRTQEGYVGLGPYIIQPEDLVSVLFGLNVPYVLRPVHEGFLLIGECYIHGVMNGEKLKEGRYKQRDFKIL